MKPARLNDIAEDFPIWLGSVLEARGWSQYKLGALAHVHPSNVGAWLEGRAQPKGKNFAAVLDSVYGEPVYIVGESDLKALLKAYRR